MKKINTLKIEHKPMHCPLCGERFMNLFGQPLPNHSQIRCTTTAGDEMDLGICDNCVEIGVTLETCNQILNGIKDYWAIEIDNNKNISDKQKKSKKDFHKSHVISQMTKISRTGKDAEKQARSQGKLK